MSFARIAGTGSYLPEQVLSNAELEQRVDTGRGTSLPVPQGCTGYGMLSE